MFSPDPQHVAEVVRQVGDRVLMPCFNKVVRQQKTDGSVLTEADLLTQAALRRALLDIAACPFVGEEMTPAEQQAQWENGAEGIWCVDPVDGTANFANGLEQFAISVAFMCNGRPKLGVIYAPALGELFCAATGQGATLNGYALNCREPATTLEDAIAEVDFKRLPEAMAIRLATRPPFHSQRNFGSAALSWCYLAAGRTDLYLHGSQHVWDFAAGALILGEAGGAMRTLDSSDFWCGGIWRKSAVAARSATLLSAWAEWLGC
jgi:myo-inositol-1(or 4)-monophosphatase